VLREELLVGRHDVPAGAHRAQHVVARRIDPADQLDDEVAAGEPGQPVPIEDLCDFDVGLHGATSGPAWPFICSTERDA